ncbi:serine protease [Aliidiomarina minuta]|uniref:Serine protease n=1 Tax=Aliidiomarina minuta TaxID=880057 RepID=A0A432W8F5_9GAMM|nr:S8 family serine peptidase [Aliidiomarina minuta]RUO26246.1 serine protease [Aliidiomarina minuta]
MKSSFQLSALAVLVAGSLVACGGSSNTAPVAEDVSLGEQRQWVGVQGTLPASDPDGDDITISFYEGGSPVSQNSDGYYEFSHGLLDLDSSTFAFTYIPLTSGSNVSFEYEASDGSLEDTGTVTIGHVSGDPLAHEQWHLYNTGQTGFAMSDETYEAWREFYIALGNPEDIVNEVIVPNPDLLVPGEDLNVIGAYKHGVTGEGSIVVVVDEGMAMNHEDLYANILPGRSVNFLEVSDRTDATKTGNGGDHGTSVAGLIAAEGWNERGGRGVAPDASLIAMNYLVPDLSLTATGWDRVDAAIHGMAGSGISTTDNVVAFNRSYGLPGPYFYGVDEIDEAMVSYPAKHLRNGLGALNIKSSGNSFINGGTTEADALCDLQQAGLVGNFSRVLSCADGNWDTFNSSFYSISVGAVNPDGGHVSYSTSGSNLLVAAPAGEFGSEEPAMVTTDQTTCTRGYSSWFEQDNNGVAVLAASEGVANFYARAYPFNSPEGSFNDEFNSSCNYTNTFNGTSSAAPNTSGVVALIAAADPDLNWREIRYILAATATQVDSEEMPINIAIGESEFVAHPGWVENAAGYSFNNNYGFGRPDAGAAVELARSGSVSLPELIETDWLEFDVSDDGVAIPDNNAEGVELSFEVEDEVTIEGVQFGFDIVNPDLLEVLMGERSGSTAASDIAIEVTSPAGTTSVIATSRTGLGAFMGQAAPFAGYAYATEGPILTNAFLGESAQGTWTVRIVDTNGSDRDIYLNNSVDSSLFAAQMRVFGH